MTTIRRRSHTDNSLARYVDSTNASLARDVLDNRPKTRLLLTRKFWTTSTILLSVVLASAFYSARTLVVARDDHARETRTLTALHDTSTELLGGILQINSLLTEYRFSGSNIASDQLARVRSEMTGDMAEIQSMAAQLDDPDLGLMVDSVVMTVQSWETTLEDLRLTPADRSTQLAEVQLIGSAGRSIELLESSLTLRTEAAKNTEARETRRGVLVGVSAVLIAVAGAALLVPMAVAGSIERLVVFQRSNKERERRLKRATSSFLDTVNNELRTPLTSISGFSEILASGDDGIDRRQQQRMIRTIYRNSQKMNELVDNVLTMLKIQTNEIRFKFSEFDARDVIRAEADKRRELAIMSEVEIVVDEPAEPIETVGDIEEVSRALRAVIDNAVTYSHRGGRVELSVQRTDDENEGPMAVYKVVDHGIGIPAEEMADVLSAFERASNAVSLSIAGAGLGLSIVDFIVSEHGGEWSITSVEHEGTEVELRFPCLRTSAERTVMNEGKGALQ